MQPVLHIVCRRCRKMGHYTFACPDNPENTATPKQQDEAYQTMHEMMGPISVVVARSRSLYRGDDDPAARGMNRQTSVAGSERSSGTSTTMGALLAR
jgi:hypothetical protein